jgi:oxygen-independent coproporphyrinogen-3 oxidase
MLLTHVILPFMAASTSIYLHIPFCVHRCGYCDFNTYAGLEDLIPAYTGALCAEIAQAGAAAMASNGERLAAHTVFFGGGTPSLLPAAEMERILGALHAAFDLLPGAEISLEANPGTLSPDYLADLRRMGFNRISLGVQSSNPLELQLLERQHDFFDVIHSVEWARKAGFDNLNLDLIFGLPYQELVSWQTTVERVLGLRPEHLSLYALTLEHGTPLAHWAGRGLIAEPDPDRAADMYEWASERLEAAGYCQYEISNWAGVRDGSLLACRHNLQYWRGLPYLGLGAGAHGYAAGTRTANVLAPAAYIRRMEAGGLPGNFPATSAAQTAAFVDREAEIGETMMMGLRLTDAGVAEADFEARFGQRLAERFRKPIDKLLRQGLIEWTDEAALGVLGELAGSVNGRRLRLTRSGRLLGNRVFVEFI